MTLQLTREQNEESIRLQKEARFMLRVLRPSIRSDGLWVGQYPKHHRYYRINLHDLPAVDGINCMAASLNGVPTKPLTPYKPTLSDLKEAYFSTLDRLGV